MSEIREPMTGAYKGVFIFTIVMAVFVFFMGAASGSKSQLGTLIWGYTAWLMYKRKNSQLVSMYKGLLWFTSFIAVVMIFLYASYGEFLGYSGFGLFFLFILALAIDYALLKFFQKMVDEEFHAVRATYEEPSTNTLPSITNEQIWEMASNELANNKREGLWAKCFAEAQGDENKAKANYLNYRFEELSNKAISQRPKATTFVNDRYVRDRLDFYNEIKLKKYMTVAKLIALLAVIVIILVVNLS